MPALVGVRAGAHGSGHGGGSSVTNSSGGSAPTLPSDATVGTVAARMIGWGGKGWIFPNQATLQTWYDRGHRGWKAGFQWLYDFGGNDNFQGSDASGLSGTQWDSQKAMQGASGSVAHSNTVGDETYLGFYFSSYQGNTYTTHPPFGSWFNDTTWTSVNSAFQRMAQASAYMSMTGLALDTEYSNWIAESGHTFASTQAQARTRGYDLARAIWGAQSNLVFLWYNFYPPGGWNNKMQQVLNAAPFPDTTTVQMDFFQGLLDGMRSIGATGRIVLADATFYRGAYNFIASATNQNAYFLNSQGIRGYASTYFDQAVWDYACDHFDLTGFTFLGTDGTAFYGNTQPTAATWSQWLLDARVYSEGPRRVEYNFDGWAGSNAQFGTGAGTDLYAAAGAITGSQAADSTTALSTSLPAFASVAASHSGGTATITCNASHAYGIRCVKVYDGATFTSGNPAASYLGAMTMVFTDGGGSVTTNYNSAYQACSYSTPYSAGHWYVLEAISIKDDTKWTTVQTT